MERVRHSAPEANISPDSRCNEIAPATRARRGWKAVAVELAALAVLFLFAASFALLPTMINLWRHF